MTLPVVPRDRRSRIDLAIRLILTIGFGFWASTCLRAAAEALHDLDWQHPQPDAVRHVLSSLSIGLFTLMYALLYAIRLKPVSRFPGLIPASVAVAGGFMLLGLAFLPPADLPLWAQALAAILIINGNLLSAYIILNLGKSFSIIPEGRALVTTGPYRHIRHPLYLAETVANAGAVLAYWSPTAIVLFAAQLMFQVARMHYEEQILRETFPDYAAYQARSWRLVPGIY